MSTRAPITDGRTAWAEFFEGVTETFDQNTASVPLILTICGVVVVILINLKLLMWMLRQPPEVDSHTDHDAA
jgi:hypothetical protein